MKDYRLSEIVAHCKEMHNRYGEKACDNCEGARFCENQFANTPQYWADEHDIEPRDMIELPYKGIVHSLLGDALVICYRNHNGEILIMPFTEEETANKFLQELKGVSK